MLGVELQATMGNAHPRPVRFVGAMDQIAARLQAQRMLAQRIIGTGRHHRRQGIAALGMLGPNGGRHAPAWPLVLGDHARGAQGRRPSLTPNGDRVGQHPLTSVLTRGRLVIEQPPRSHIDDDTLARRIGEKVTAGDQYLGPFLGQPDIHLGVGGNDGVISDLIAPGDIQKRIAAVHTHPPQLTDDLGIAINREVIDGCQRPVGDRIRLQIDKQRELAVGHRPRQACTASKQLPEHQRHCRPLADRPPAHGFPFMALADRLSW